MEEGCSVVVSVFDTRHLESSPSRPADLHQPSAVELICFTTSLAFADTLIDVLAPCIETSLHCIPAPPSLGNSDDTPNFEPSL
jgi:hypothetical protein